MSLTVSIELRNDVDDAEAARLSRDANVAGIPLRVVRRAGLLRREVAPHAVLEDLDDDPSIGSETLDSPDAWPQSQDVQEWLARAVGFLVDYVGEFTFHAGWPEQRPSRDEHLRGNDFIVRIRVGGLRSDTRYVIT